MSEFTTDRGPWDEVPGGLGVVLDEGRGSLPYALIHGEALVACAVWALGEAGVTPMDATVEWGLLADAGEPVVLHDSLCPMTPPDFIASVVRRCLLEDAVVVATRPVTDTVKAVQGEVIGETIDRDQLIAVASPLVLPAHVAATLAGPPSDLATTVADLAADGHRVVTMAAPPEARRVTSTHAVEVLAALTG